MKNFTKRQNAAKSKKRIADDQLLSTVVIDILIDLGFMVSIPTDGLDISETCDILYSCKIIPIYTEAYTAKKDIRSTGCHN